MTSPTQMVKRLFFLHRRYENMVATMLRWFGFIFWLMWMLQAVMAVVVQGDGALAVIYLVSASVFALLFRLIFGKVAAANGWTSTENERR